MSERLDLDVLDGMLDARLDALMRRARAEDDVSFGAGGDGADPATESLWRLVEQAQPGGEPLSFDPDAGEPGPLARARRECAQLADAVLRDLAHPVVVETGPDRPRIRTQIGWTGDADTRVAPHASVAEVTAHAVAVEASVRASTRRLRLLTMIVTAAGTIAAMLVAPGAAAMALPIAYRCVRDVYEQWSASTPD